MGAPARSRAPLFLTPWTVAHQALLWDFPGKNMEWHGLPCPLPGDLPDPGIEPWSPALQADSLPVKPPGKPQEKSAREQIIARFEN